MEECKEELQVLFKLNNNDNITETNDIFTEKDIESTEYKVTIINELCDESLKHELHKRINSHKTFTKEHLLKIFMDSTTTLKHIVDTNKIAHHNLKPDNILLKDD